jgi:hypothetical protein
MYCQVCGAESTQSGKYCKRCGASLSQTAGTTGPVNVSLKLTGMFLLAITMITVIGLFMAIITPSELAYKGYPSEMVAMIVILSIAIAIGIDLLLVKLLLHLLKLSHEGYTVSPQNAATTAPVHVPPQLPPQMAGTLTVTEHTTRNFEPAVDDVSSSRGGEVNQRATR